MSCGEKISFETPERAIAGRKPHLGVPQQLHNPTLVRRETDNLPNDAANELRARRLDALAMAGLDNLGDGGRGVALVKAVTDV